jgi:RHS repeat-associated protein
MPHLPREDDLYGVARVDVARTACPWRWPGQYEDEETGLYYNRFRYYDPRAGRYISQDPIGLYGGTALYAYVHDPLAWIDVFGLNCGKVGERIARSDLRRRGFDLLGGIRNKSGHGIDIVARDTAGKLWFFEVKTTTGLVAPALSKAQARGAQHFVWDRLGRADFAKVAWQAVDDPHVATRARDLIDELRKIGGQSAVVGEIIEVTLGNSSIKTKPW